MAAELPAGRIRWLIGVIAVAGGLLLGGLDLAAQRALPYPWANLANSAAVWAVAAFGVGVVSAGPGIRGRLGRWQPAIVGLIVLLVALESYYVAAALWLHDAWSSLWLPVTLMWLLFAAIAGPVFGMAGGWSRSGSSRMLIIGAALPGAVLFAEAGVLIYRSGSGDAAYRTDSLQSAAIETALGVLIIVLAGRTARQRVSSLASSVPLTVLGFGLFIAAGFGR